MSLWPKLWSELGTAVSLATGIPSLFSTTAGLWAYFSGAGLSVALTIALVMLAVFMMTLWCCIGVLWLRDREQIVSGSTEPIDCSWGIRIESVILNRDPCSEMEWQVRLGLRNIKNFPIRADVVEQRVVIESHVPNVRMDREPFLCPLPRRADRDFTPAVQEGLAAGL